MFFFIFSITLSFFFLSTFSFFFFLFPHFFKTSKI